MLQAVPSSATSATVADRWSRLGSEAGRCGSLVDVAALGGVTVRSDTARGTRSESCSESSWCTDDESRVMPSSCAGRAPSVSASKVENTRAGNGRSITLARSQTRLKNLGAPRP